MEIQLSGKHSQNFSTTCLWQLSLRTRSSASMVDSPLVSIPLTRLDSLTESRRLLMKGQSAIFSGPILMTDVVGVSVQEVLVTLSAKTSQSNSITQTTSQESQELISLLWTDTTGHTSAM
jgi:hypothetical protein